MRLGSIYLVVDDFEASIAFYEKLLDMPLSTPNNGRFVSFYFCGHCISLMNGHFDAQNPEKVVKKGNLAGWADVSPPGDHDPETRRFALNFWSDDLRAEHQRIKPLNLSPHLSEINYLCYVAPYYYFCLTDPDGNMIEIAGNYSHAPGEFDNQQ